ncbi:hypothetical protein ON010_g12808 [Phytophthora cinnamomi]|nr:hypothetical protein ON010_g12808 [Phytophthora cinnamomi]
MDAMTRVHLPEKHWITSKYVSTTVSTLAAIFTRHHLSPSATSRPVHNTHQVSGFRSRLCCWAATSFPFLAADDQGACTDDHGPVPPSRDRRGQAGPERGRHPHRLCARARRQDRRARTQPPRPAWQRRAARRDGLPRERRAAHGRRLRARHALLDAEPVRYVQRRRAALQDPDGRRGREQDVPGSRAVRALERSRPQAAAGRDVHQAHGGLHPRQAAALERGHRRLKQQRPHQSRQS